MTNLDVIKTILSEVTGRRMDELDQVGIALAKMMPGANKLNQELDPKAAKILLEQLREERSGILNWALEKFPNLVKPEQKNE